ncbi:MULTISPECIES: translesion DNA synthesis-associated protein ImuA [Thiorhodovibrio]|uniref:translesion DNA synthesis-associated protein ImuA n=1 Tax=Thiorhodovibrio TaxID=61593 RepID=UPI0019131808|nr:MULTISPECIES: translesion DNA synthesis-associated protein ImuA [Thiorhodovibrio]MBK5969906.1 hypothetical protein [Thiorhodovibrio winogradskyi]WPL12049.1 SOS cell division inhibitor [Thiorhodovibrio litoralis]
MSLASAPVRDARLEALLAQRGDLWRGRSGASCEAPGMATGFALLDQALVGGGWPQAGLCEILTDQPGPGLALILPLLARLGARRPWILMAAPPLLPYAPALAAAGLRLSRLLVVTRQPALWVMEQGLQAASCAAVVGWLDRGTAADLRRLQLASTQTQTPAFVFRPPPMSRQPSPARLRLQLCAMTQNRLELRLLKQRGRTATISLPL